MQRTGVEIIDRVLGGIAPGLPLVLAGPSGSGRTLLSLQLAATALDNGAVVSYLCNEPSPFLIQQAATLGFDLESRVETGQLVLLELAPDIGTLVRGYGLGAFASTARAEEPLSSLLVVDPFTVLTSELMDEPALRSEVRAFVKAASPCNVILTVESEQCAIQRGVERVLSEVCGAFVSLGRDAAGRRELRVEKTRGGIAAAESATFEIAHGGAQLCETQAASDPAPEQSEPSRRESPPVAASGPPAEPTPEAAAPFVEVRDESTQTAPEESRSTRTSNKRRTVLIVDHDRQTRETLRKWLEDEYEVITAGDGFEAMTTVLTNRPDLVLLDLVMPRVNGYELLAAFQRTANDIPMLVISGRVQRPADRLAPLVLGATDFLPKPIERIELVHKVDTLLRLDGPPRQWLDPADAEDLFASMSQGRLLSLDDFRARVGRSARFGERCGLRSSLIAIAAPTSSALDAWLETAEEGLRFEDSVARFSGRRALILMLAVEAADAPKVLSRLETAYETTGNRSKRLEIDFHDAASIEESSDWRHLFRGRTKRGGEAQ